MTRQIDNTLPGGAPGGKLVAGSQKRCELGHKGSDTQWLCLLMRTVVRFAYENNSVLKGVLLIPGKYSSDA